MVIGVKDNILKKIYDYKFEVLDGLKKKGVDDSSLTSFTPRIILSESDDERVVEAASIVKSLGLAEPILMGDKDKILSLLEAKGLREDFEIVDPKGLGDDHKEELALFLFDRRKHKGWSFKKALSSIEDNNYLSAVLVAKGDYDAYISGNRSSTADSLRPALQVIGPDPLWGYVSSHFLMITNKGSFLFADCGLNVDPSPKELAIIAFQTAFSAQGYGLKPRVAFLSHSTKGSAINDRQKKMASAVVEFKGLLDSLSDNPLVGSLSKDLLFDGELQLDSAIDLSVRGKKDPSSSLGGEVANVLIFPDIDSGNIGYKLVQRFGGAKAIGPVVQGLSAEAHDLSRGCSVDDIVDMVAIVSQRVINKRLSTLTDSGKK